MDDNRLTRSDRPAPELYPEPRSDRERSLARLQAIPWLLVIVLLAATAWLGWRAFFHEEEGDPVASAMLAFERQNSLNVFSSRFEVVAESTSTPRVGPFQVEALQSRQAMIVPAMVEYRLDLSQMDRNHFAWSPDNSTLTVTLPPLRVSRPNLDEAAARYFTEGVFVSRGASTSLSANNSRQAEASALTFARSPEILNLARDAARDAIRQNLTIPLQVAGYDEVKVEVRFANPAPARR